MKNDQNKGLTRRELGKRTIISVAVAAIATILPSFSFAGKTDKPLKIGIVGAGKIGGSVGVLWAKAGHEVFFSSRHPEELVEMVKEAGPMAKLGTPMEAATFGEVVFIAVPYHAMPKVGMDLSPVLQPADIFTFCMALAEGIRVKIKTFPP